MRLLKTLVIVMGVVLVVGFGALIFIIVTRMAAPKPEPVAVAVPPVVEARPAEVALPSAALPGASAGDSLPPHFTPNFGEQSLVLPPGARVSDFSAGADRLVLRLILPDQSQQLAVVDLNTGALIGTLKLETGDNAPPSVLAPLQGITVPPRNRQEGRK